MARKFNVTGACNPKFHYMVDIRNKLEEMKGLIDSGAYFTVNRARQYGKTTTLAALTEYLKDDYVVIPLDFQKIGAAKFATEHIFSKTFVNYLCRTVKSGIPSVMGLDTSIAENMLETAQRDEQYALDDMFPQLSELCATAKKPVVMIIDEVDSAANNQVFLDFLAQLRSYYLDRTIHSIPIFQSVILAGVYDVKNIRRKLRPEDEHKVNSPWNIATDFLVNMSFSKEGIAGMLQEYEEDHRTGMDIDRIAGLVFDSTSGYPYLVSKLCMLIDERIAGTEEFPEKEAAWTEAGYREAEKLLIHEKNTLFESLTGKLEEYPELKKLLVSILFDGKSVSYVSNNSLIEVASMLGFIKNENNTVAVANRIFETVLYNQFLSEEEVDSLVYASALAEKNRFVQGGKLNMNLVLERFVAAFTELYKEEEDRFKEEIARKYFMLFLKPIINGKGHSYVESRTRDMKRTDIIVDYNGEQFIIELKIWRGAKYHEKGEEQIAEYLNYYQLKKGYMVVFDFNKDKEIGVTEKQYGDKILVEAIV